MTGRMHSKKRRFRKKFRNNLLSSGPDTTSGPFFCPGTLCLDKAKKNPRPRAGKEEGWYGRTGRRTGRPVGEGSDGHRHPVSATAAEGDHAPEGVLPVYLPVI